ncbi:MAG: site-2 protease family protein, partial [Candidatus Eiseniibacteriota bacterium]
ILRGLDASGHEFTGPVETAVVRMLMWSVILNLSLAAFNMIPIFPLDGSKVLTGLLNPIAAARYQSYERYGPFVLLGLILLGSLSGVSVIGIVVGPFVRTVGSFFTGGLL